MKKILALVLAVAMIASVAMLTGCGQTSDNGEKTYVIYSDNAFAPFEYLDTESDAYIGVDMDLMAAIAEDQGIKYEMHNEGFDAAMGAVQSGQADAMIAGMTITDERKETFDFSDSYYEEGQVIVAKEGTKMEDLKDKTVAVKASTQGKDYAESIKDEYGFSINVYEGSDNMYQAVETGADVACFEDYAVIKYAIDTGKVKLSIISDDRANVKPYGFAVQKGKNTELLEKFNAGLANIKANGKYKEICEKYGLEIK